MKRYKGFLFDLNGTMINDMSYHIGAWHRILNGLGAGISLERMKEECYGKMKNCWNASSPGGFRWRKKQGWVSRRKKNTKRHSAPA